MILDSENTADNTGPRSFVYDAPPSYVDAINVPQDQNVARPQVGCDLTIIAYGL